MDLSRLPPDVLAAALGDRLQVLLGIAITCVVIAVLLARLPVRCQHRWDCPQCAADARAAQDRSDEYNHRTFHVRGISEPGCARCRNQQDKERE